MFSPTDPAKDSVGEKVDATYRYRVYMYLAMVLWVAFIWWRVEQTENDRQEKDREIISQVEAEAEARIADVEQEAIQRDYAVCLRGNELRATLLGYIKSLQTQFGAGRTTDALVAQAAVDFKQVECPPPPK